MPNNTKIQYLHIHDNLMSNLDIRNKPNLTQIYLYNNLFTTAGIDSIYCQLPTISGTQGQICPAKNRDDINLQTVIATNAQNALDRNWRVLFFEMKEPINTTGNASCPATSDLFEATTEEGMLLNIFPNPAENFIVVSTPNMPDKEQTLYIYNQLGQVIYQSTYLGQQTIETTSWNTGIYYIKIGKYSGKFVKE